MTFQIEDLVFREDVDIDLYCSVKFTFGIKVEKKVVGTCKVCINNLFNLVEFQDGYGSYFTFKPFDDECLESQDNTSTSADLLENGQFNSVERDIVGRSHPPSICDTKKHFQMGSPFPRDVITKGEPSNLIINSISAENQFSKRIDQDRENIPCQVKTRQNTKDAEIHPAGVAINNEGINLTEMINAGSVEESTLQNEACESVQLKLEENVNTAEMFGSPKNSTEKHISDIWCEIDGCSDNVSPCLSLKETGDYEDHQRCEIKFEENEIDHFDTCHENTEVKEFVDNPLSSNVTTSIKTSNQSVSNFQCQECGKSLSSKGSLKRHIRCMHKDVKLFECQKCDCYFMEDFDLVLHNGSFHEKTEEFKCNICSKTFSKKHHLQRHGEIHIGTKSFQCQKCGKTFMLKHHLTQHQMIHDGIKPHKCIVCGKDFVLKSSLMRHEQVHTGIKPFRCKECGKNFSQKSSLFEHQNIHSNIKIFQCDQCEKWFSRKSYLARHMKIHEGIKSFQCDVCGKSFTQKGNLKVHNIKIHGRTK